MTIYDKVTLIECAMRIANMDKDVSVEILGRLYRINVECVKCPFYKKCTNDKLCDCERFIENELLGR